VDKNSPTYGNQPDLDIFLGGKKTAGTPHRTTKNGIGIDIVHPMGVNRITGLPESLESTEGAMHTTDSGFYPDVINFIYYVREVDYNLYQGANQLYVNDSLGRHKKIVTFKNTAAPTDLAQVTILYYQVPAFPTKITGIKTYYDKVENYLENGTGDTFYDHNSAAQQSIVPNP
jgi:hypothetical protein